MKIFFIVLYIIGVVFVLAGAVNAGWSLYFMAVPFMVFLLWVSKSKLNSQKLFYFSIFLIIFSIIVSHTQKINPVLFPIISGGYVEILKDGYQQSFSDGSGGFSLENSDNRCTGCGEIKYTKVKKGDIYKVIGIRIGHPDFGTNFSLITDIGEFDEDDSKANNDFGIEKYIEINKPIRAKWTDTLSLLMAWPVLPILMVF